MNNKRIDMEYKPIRIVLRRTSYTLSNVEAVARRNNESSLGKIWTDSYNICIF